MGVVHLIELSLQVKIIGVEPSDANAMALSLFHGQRIILEQVGGFADGVAVKMVGEETFCLCRELVDGVVLVGRDAICASIKVNFILNLLLLCLICHHSDLILYVCFLCNCSLTLSPCKDLYLLK